MKKSVGTKTSSFGTNGRINHDSTKFYDSKLYKELKSEIKLADFENELPIELVNNIIAEWVLVALPNEFVRQL